MRGPDCESACPAGDFRHAGALPIAVHGAPIKFRMRTAMVSRMLRPGFSGVAPSGACREALRSAQAHQEAVIRRAQQHRAQHVRDEHEHQQLAHVALELQVGEQPGRDAAGEAQAGEDHRLAGLVQGLEVALAQAHALLAHLVL